jgi:hypothetical protein
MQQCGYVIWSFNILRLFNLYYGSVGDSARKYWLDLRTFVAEKLPDNGTLVPKHVGFGT